MSVEQLNFIHQYVPAPEAAERQPTLLLLHGTGGDERDLLALGRTLMPQAGLLSPRGRVSEGGMPRFFRRLAPGVFDEDDLRRRTAELRDFVLAAAATHHFDVEQVIAVGYSNGANIAASLLLLYPDLLRAAVLFRPMVPLVPEPLPALAGTPVFISAGRFDQMVPADQTAKLATLLEQAGAVITLDWQESDHPISINDVRPAKTWLDQLQASS